VERLSGLLRNDLEEKFTNKGKRFRAFLKIPMAKFLTIEVVSSKVKASANYKNEADYHPFMLRMSNKQDGLSNSNSKRL